jgi:hypothetical protein
MHHGAVARTVTECACNMCFIYCLEPWRLLLSPHLCAVAYTVRLRSVSENPGSSVCRTAPSLKSEDISVVPARHKQGIQTHQGVLLQSMHKASTVHPQDTKVVPARRRYRESCKACIRLFLQGVSKTLPARHAYACSCKAYIRLFLQGIHKAVCAGHAPQPATTINAAAATAVCVARHNHHTPFRMLTFMYCTAMSGADASVSCIFCTLMHSWLVRVAQAESTGKKNVAFALRSCKRVAQSRNMLSITLTQTVQLQSTLLYSSGVSELHGSSSRATTQP